MYENLIYFFIAISLSMDAFSLALVYGTKKISLKKKIILSITVGIFHFIMPLLGAITSSKLFLKYLEFSDYLIGIIFIILSIEMLRDKEEITIIKLKNIWSIIFFATTVSIDSFSVGLALSLREETIFKAFLIFSITSCLFTMLGLKLGHKLSTYLAKKANFLGGIILLIIGLKYIFFNN